jgi:hypothetical protein
VLEQASSGRPLGFPPTCTTATHSTTQPAERMRGYTVARSCWNRRAAVGPWGSSPPAQYTISMRMRSYGWVHVGTGAQRRALGIPAHLCHSHSQHHTTYRAHARLKMVEHAHRLQCACAVMKGRIGQRMQGWAHGVIPSTCATATHRATQPARRTRAEVLKFRLESQYVLY